MAEPLLQIQGISKSFGALKASDGVTLDLYPGEIHALIGPNGAGKSTLIAQIAGSLKPDSGRVILEGRDVTATDTVARARAGLGRTFQISSLAMEDTVMQNAVLGALGARQGRLGLFARVMRNQKLREVAMAALREVGIEEFANFRTADLSHGQRRQLEVAVALTLNPHVFLMDEPMAGLGAEGSVTLVSFLQNLKRARRSCWLNMTWTLCSNLPTGSACWSMGASSPPEHRMKFVPTPRCAKPTSVKKTTKRRGRHEPASATEHIGFLRPLAGAI